VTVETPLDGWRVVVTGDTARTSSLADRVSALGGDVVRLPVVVIEEPPDSGAALAAATDRLLAGDYRWVIVTSGNAVERLRRAFAGRPVPEGVRWAAVGPSTERALVAAGLPCDLVPSESSADALAAAFVASAGPGRVLYPRAEHVHSDLAARLVDSGWPVDEVVAYRTVGRDPGLAALDAARRSDVVLFASASAVERTVALLGPHGVPPDVLTIGPSTSAAVRQAGLHVAAEAEPHSADALVDALVILVRSRTAAPGP
jgi:uroporphyrinogen III methyltransferase / synthase